MRTRKDMRTAEADWRATKHVAPKPVQQRKRTLGDIIGGANTGLQTILRPRLALDPYATGVDGVYLCSQSAPPGAGIHGLCGMHAADSALRSIGRR